MCVYLWVWGSEADEGDVTAARAPRALLLDDLVEVGLVHDELDRPGRRAPAPARGGLLAPHAAPHSELHVLYLERFKLVH